MEARLNALHGALKEAQSQLADAVAASQAHQRARAEAERAAATAEDTASRLQREGEQRVQRAEAAASAAAVQVGGSEEGYAGGCGRAAGAQASAHSHRNAHAHVVARSDTAQCQPFAPTVAQVAEFRKALAGVERERDQLLAEKEQRERATREAAAVVASARRRGGDGGLSAERRSSLAPAASGALPSPSAWFGGAGGGSEAPLPSPLPSVRQRDTLEATDVLYLKNGELCVLCLLGNEHRRAAAEVQQGSVGLVGLVTKSCLWAQCLSLWLHTGFCLLHKLYTRIHLPRCCSLQCCSSSWTRTSGVCGWQACGLAGTGKDDGWPASPVQPYGRGKLCDPFLGCLSAVCSYRHNHTLTIQH